MGFYSRLKPGARGFVDRAFEGVSDGELRGMNLPTLKELEGKLEVFYPDDATKRAGVLGDYRLCVAVRRLGASMKKAEIARNLGLPPRTVHSWVSDKLPGDFGDMYQIADYQIPVSESVDFASFLGFVLSSRGRHAHAGKLQMSSVEKPLIVEYERAVKNLWGARCTRRVHDDVSYSIFYSQKVFNYLKIFTDNWITLPWEHLYTERERKAFLRAWLSNSSSIIMPITGREGKVKSKSVVETNKTVSDGKQLGLLQDLRVLMLKLGFSTTLVKHASDRCSLRILEDEDQQRILSEGYFIQDSKKRQLERALRESRKRESGMHTRSEYHTFGLLLEGGLHYSDAGRIVGVSPESARKWSRGEGLPNAVKWELEVGGLERARKPDVIGFAFRNIEASHGKARKLALENPGEVEGMMRSRGTAESPSSSSDVIQNLLGVFGSLEAIHRRVPVDVLRKLGFRIDIVREAGSPMGPSYRLKKLS